MTNENFRRELGHVFDDMAGSPSSALSDRVRSSLASAPEQRGPYWIAGLAAALIAVVVIGVLFVGNPLNRPPSRTVPGAGASPTATATATAAPFTAAPATASPFVCTPNGATSYGSSPPPVAFIDALRTGSHPGYDRLTIEFTNGEPTSLDVQLQDGAAFTLSPSGRPVTLAGANGILVTIHGADLHTDYSGPTDILTHYSGMVEVRQVEDFEGVVQIAIGISGPKCMNTSVVLNPTRLVIDVAAP
jgi:hypothetical protein